MNDSQKGELWNNTLSLVSIINMMIITYYYFNYKDKMDGKHSFITILGMIYVFICGIRSIWPREEHGSLCFYDNIISTPFMGRSLATIAELSFVLFLVIITDTFLNDSLNITKIKNINYLIKTNLILFPLMLIAQLCCWIGVTTKRAGWNVIEESLWSIFAILKIVIYSVLLYHISQKNISNPKIKFLKLLLPILIILYIFYGLYMICVDVPMYIDKSNKNNKFYNFINGLKELNICNNITHSFKDWENDIVWMTGYFTIAVWFCLAMLFIYNKYIYM